MRGILRLAVLMTLLVLLAGPMASVRSAPPKKELTESEIREKLLAKPYLEGKLTDIDTTSEDKTFTLKAAWQVKTPSVEGARKFQQIGPGLMQQGSEALRTNNKAAYEKAAEEFAAAKAGCWDIEETPCDFHLKGVADLKVRRLELPPKETADGKPARYTEKEKAELRGKDPTLPGYKAELKDLEDGTHVRVYLLKGKKPAVPEAPKDKPKETDPPADVIHQVLMIVISPEPKAVEGANPFGK